MKSHPSMSLLRSVTVGGNRSPSPTVDRSFQYDTKLNQSSTNDTTEPKLRTFRGWKRSTAQLDKSRLGKSLWVSQVSFFFAKSKIFFSIDLLSRHRLNQV